jgi:predicted O-methyltransferase YrrM
VLNRLLNIARNASYRSNYRVLLRKILARRELDTSIEGHAWARDQCEPFWTFAAEQEPDIAREARHVEIDLLREAESKLETLPVRLGGGFVGLLYFYTRLRKPKVVVETGVAAGFSSKSVLLALRANGGGRLYSSDFPYFRLAEPERYIGWLVEDALRKDWDLSIEGDVITLPRLAEKLPRIDLFHYDSDKSVAGRRFAMSTIGSKLAEGSTVIMDDVQDNIFFRDFVQATCQTYKVFGYSGKYIGVIPSWQLNRPAPEERIQL